jgi:hypothetical protein
LGGTVVVVDTEVVVDGTVEVAVGATVVEVTIVDGDGAVASGEVLTST